MKVIANTFEENKAGFEVLSLEDLSGIRGGGTPKSRDKDIFDFEEE